MLRQEAEATAAAHRQAFDDMVAAARAAPAATAAPDPMRFRALPPGEGVISNGLQPQAWHAAQRQLQRRVPASAQNRQPFAAKTQGWPVAVSLTGGAMIDVGADVLYSFI